VRPGRSLVGGTSHGVMWGIEQDPEGWDPARRGSTTSVIADRRQGRNDRAAVGVRM